MTLVPGCSQFFLKGVTASRDNAIRRWNAALESFVP